MSSCPPVGRLSVALAAILGGTAVDAAATAASTQHLARR
jgi:hypothetical protein